MTEVADIPFKPGQESGWDALGGATVTAVNVVIDAKGCVRRRPGLQSYAGAYNGYLDFYDEDGLIVPDVGVTAGPVTGIYATEDGSELFATAGHLPKERLYRLRADEVDVLGQTTGSQRPVWAETEALVVWADGRQVNRLTRGSVEYGPLNANAPVATHVISHGARLLANDIVEDRTKVRYSAPAQGTVTWAGHEQWTAETTANGTSGFFTAEARPDPVVALGENSNEVVVFGTGTVQAFAPDASFAYVSVATRENGCAAPYSVIRDDQAFAWLDHRRRIVHSDIRSVSILSDPIQRTLDEMARVDDCFGYRVTHGAVDALVWTFPTDGRTFCYQKGGGWSLWMGWSDTLNNLTRFQVNAHTHIVGANAHVVGLVDGRVAQMATGVLTDMGVRIPAHVETGAIDRGTDRRKLCVAVRLTLRRGGTSGSTEPVATVSWRDNDGPWQSPVHVSLGKSGDVETVVSLRGCGVYRNRRWRFDFHGTTEDLVLAKATEEYEVLDT